MAGTCIRCGGQTTNTRMNTHGLCFGCEHGMNPNGVRPNLLKIGGHVYYTCGHTEENSDVPQDQDWQSEVACPDCRITAAAGDLYIALTLMYDNQPLTALTTEERRKIMDKAEAAIRKAEEGE